LPATCNKNEQQKDTPRVVLSYWPNGRRQYGILVKRPLEEDATGLWRSNC